MKKLIIIASLLATLLSNPVWAQMATPGQRPHAGQVAQTNKPNAFTKAQTFSPPIPMTSGGTGLSVGTSGGVCYFNSTTSIASSALLTANALMLGGGSGTAPTVLGSLGTTTTILHGNAGGAPTFGAVVLTTDVSGLLPSANGGAGTLTGVLKATSGTTSVATNGTDYLSPGTTGTLTVGYSVTSTSSGTKSSGTFTPAFATNNMQFITNGGAFTLAPPTGEGTMVIEMVNNGTAGAVTTSGFTKVTGDTLTTTNTSKFDLFITVLNSTSLLNVVALQ